MVQSTTLRKAISEYEYFLQREIDNGSMSEKVEASGHMYGFQKIFREVKDSLEHEEQ